MIKRTIRANRQLEIECSADHLFRISLLYCERLRYTGIMFGTFRAYYSIARQNVSRDSPREGKGDTTGTVCIYEQEEYGA